MNDEMFVNKNRALNDYTANLPTNKQPKQWKEPKKVDIWINSSSAIEFNDKNKP